VHKQLFLTIVDTIYSKKRCLLASFYKAPSINRPCCKRQATPWKEKGKKTIRDPIPGSACPTWQFSQQSKCCTFTPWSAGNKRGYVKVTLIREIFQDPWMTRYYTLHDILFSHELVGIAGFVGNLYFTLLPGKIKLC